MTKAPTERSFDELAMGFESGVISRSKALKLGGAALLASAAGLVTSPDAQAISFRRRCLEAGREFCRSREGRCRTCCRRRRNACCGRHGCTCCRRGERCNSGKCLP
jgi:hypothetical protein